jgi:hypothetical protein
MRFKLTSSLRPLILQAMCRIEETMLDHQARRETSQQAVEVDCPTPGWLQPHPQRDLAARLAGALALRNSLRVGYLAVGECAFHALVRICLQTGGISRSALEDRGLTKEESQRLVGKVAKLALSKLVLHERAVYRDEVRIQTKEFIKEANLEVIIVDEPDVPTLRDLKLSRELDHWRVRMEFREAVRGTNVMMILPG